MSAIPRNQTIEAIKVIAIILVVIGHLLARPDPYFPDYLYQIKAAIYTFHMPLFMFVSGFATAKAAHHWRKKPFSQYAKNRFYRLVIPAFIIILCAITAKSIAAQFLYVDNWNGNILRSLTAYFTHSESAPILFVWYLIALFYLNLLYRLLNFRAEIPLLLIFLLINLTVFNTNIHMPQVLFFDRFILYAPFFFIGCIIAKLDILSQVNQLAAPLLISLTILVTLIFALLLVFNSTATLYVNGVVSIVFFTLIPTIFKNHLPWRIIHFTAGFTLLIYLTNVFAIGAAKAVIYKLGLDIPPLFVLLILFLSGFFGPLFIGIFIRKNMPRVFAYVR